MRRNEEKKIRPHPRTGQAVLAFSALPAVLLLYPPAAGAVDALSSRKLIVPKANPLAPGEIEFEPELTTSTYDHALDRDHHLIALDGRFRDTEMDFRLTAGLSPRQEVGALFGVATSTFSGHRRANAVARIFKSCYWHEGEQE
jgi:hypothetical protein